MQNYTIIKELGSGSYGTVYSATENKTQRVVAIKRIHERASWDQAKNLVELKSFKKIREHPNLVTLYELFRERDGTVYFVFELISGGSLYDYLVRCQRAGRAPAEREVRAVVCRCLRGLGHIHASGFMHRDLKLENVLMNQQPDGVALALAPEPLMPKLADLGCAKETRARVVQNTVYTGTRWYRSFELLLRDARYGRPNDVWAMGCIAFELFMMRPLFQGQSELDMLHLVLQTLGPLLDGEYPDYAGLAARMGFTSSIPVSRAPHTPGASHARIRDKLAQVMRGASSDFVDCLAHMLELNPDLRWDVPTLLAHPWFRSEQQGAAPPPRPSDAPRQQDGAKPAQESDVLAKARQMLSGQRAAGAGLDHVFSDDILAAMSRRGAEKRSQSTFPPKTCQRRTRDFLKDNDELDANLDMMDDIDF